MAVIEKFLEKRVIIPDNLLTKQNRAFGRNRNKMALFLV
jgi:hypothetical protein